MDDTEYYSMMRRQYSNLVDFSSKKKSSSLKTPGTFSEWNVKHGHEDAEMFQERNKESEDSDE